MVGKKGSNKRGGGTAKESATAAKEVQEENRLPATIRSAVVFSVVTVFYAVQRRWWMVAIFCSITAGFVTNALSQVNQDRPAAKRAFSYAYYFFFILSVALAVFGMVTRQF